MGLWCRGVTRLLVPMSVASVLEGASHSGKGTCTSCNGDCPVGGPVAIDYSPHPVRQCSSGRGCLIRLSKGPHTHASFALMLHFFLSHYDLNLTRIRDLVLGG